MQFIDKKDAEIASTQQFFCTKFISDPSHYMCVIIIEQQTHLSAFPPASHVLRVSPLLPQTSGRLQVLHWP